MGRVYVVGSLNIDLVARVQRWPGPGETVLGAGLERMAAGKGANQAVAASAAGADVVMLGCVGSDQAGAMYVRRLLALGVDVAPIRSVPDCPTGHALVAVDDAGRRTTVLIPGANAAVTVDDLRALRSSGPEDLVLLQLEVPLAVVTFAARQASATGARVLLNLAPHAHLPPDVVALADPLVVNEGEALLLADSQALPASLVVSFGAAAAAWDGDQVSAPVVDQARVVDATGADDALCGALAAALVSGAGRRQALRAGLEASADALTHRGAQHDPGL